MTGKKGATARKARNIGRVVVVVAKMTGKKGATARKARKIGSVVAKMTGEKERRPERPERLEE